MAWKTYQSGTSSLRFDAGEPYHSIFFDLPSGLRRVRFSGTYTSRGLSQLPVAFYSPEAQLRGIYVYPYAAGKISIDFWIGVTSSGKGGTPGPIAEGRWTAKVFVRKLEDTVALNYIISASTEDASEEDDDTLPQGSHDLDVVTRTRGDRSGDEGNQSVPESCGNRCWIQGDLHAHTLESTGELSVAETLRHLWNLGFDFQALTDHFTISHWSKQDSFRNRMILLNSCEIPGLFGHANAHGLRQWVDPFVDGDGWSMNDAAREVHRQGGLFCINHPFNGPLGWSYQEFDWNLADLIEIYNPPEGPNFLLQTAFWDHLLLTGHRIVGVAGSDTHNPVRKGSVWEVGGLRTWVAVREKSSAGLIEGLRSGQVMISRNARLDFQLSDGAGNRYGMFEKVPEVQPVTLRMTVAADQPSRLFVIRNGLCMRVIDVEISSSGRVAELELHDIPRERGYYRIELHTAYRDSFCSGIAWRDHTTMLAITNPIFVG